MRKIRRVSAFSGKTYEMEIDVTDEQYQAWLDGALVQDAMPNLTPEEREFIISGIPPKEWNEAFGDDK